MKVKPYWHPLGRRHAPSDVPARQRRGMSGPQEARGPKAVAQIPAPALGGDRRRFRRVPAAPARSSCNALKLNKFAGDIIWLAAAMSRSTAARCSKAPTTCREGSTLPCSRCRQPAYAKPSRPARAARSARRWCSPQVLPKSAKARRRTRSRRSRAVGRACNGRPNCLGVTNNVDGMLLHMLFAREARRGVESGVAFVGQSGGLLGHFQRASDGRGIPLSYVISTGNEAGLESDRFHRISGRRPSTRVIVALHRASAAAARFLAAIRRCRDAGKPVVLMFPGRSEKSRKAAKSHTGALVGDMPP